MGSGSEPHHEQLGLKDWLGGNLVFFSISKDIIML